MIKNRQPYRTIRSAGTIDEAVRMEMVTKLNRLGIFQDTEGRELQSSPYGAVKRRYSLYLIREGLQPNGEPE